MSGSESAAARAALEDEKETTTQREQAVEDLFGTRVILGPLQLKKPLLRHEIDDGLTDAQRSAQQATERRLAESAAKEKSYRDRIQEFNEKLSKLTDHNEM